MKLNLPSSDRDFAIEVLREIESIRFAAVRYDRYHGQVHESDGASVRKKSVVADWGLNLLVAFGLRFFCGPLEERGPEEQIPNFPPGGVFAARVPTRFGMCDRRVPVYLRSMNATGDRDWVAKRLADTGVVQNVDEDAAAGAYKEWISQCESDLLLYLECDNRFLLIDLWDTLRRRVVESYGLMLSGPIQEGFNRSDGRDHTGWLDGISNMDDLIESDPQYYRSKIYLPHPAPAYPGEPSWARDEPRYDGGTYMVYRKYIEHLDDWNSDDFSIADSEGNVYFGEEARCRAIGRDRHTGRVISRINGQMLERERDSTEVNLAPAHSHILQARGGTSAPFCGPFPPLQSGETNVFQIQDVRIRRRGANFCELDRDSGVVTYGLHFICFQNNVQQTGFEFINNIWLLNPMFREHLDPVLDPKRGFVEPVDGCYYFVPPDHRRYPGDVFFE